MTEIKTNAIPHRLKNVNKQHPYVSGARDIYDDAKGKSQAEVNADVDDTFALHQSEINALDSQNYVTVATYSALPATGSADTIYRVSSYDGTQVDDTVYSEYAWNGSAYVHLSTKTQIGEVFDISAYHATGGTLAKYADLAAALNGGANIPQSLQKGGMSVKYVRTSDNKYVQYRYMSSSTADADFTNTANWQGVDAEPTAGSDNLVKSGGVAEQNLYIGELHQGFINDSNQWKNLTSGGRYYSVIPIDVAGGEYLSVIGHNASVVACLSAYNPIEGGDANVLDKRLIADGETKIFSVPDGTRYIYVLAISMTDRVPTKMLYGYNGEIDLLAVAKNNILSLRKFTIENFATKTEEQQVDSKVTMALSSIALLTNNVYGEYIDSNYVIAAGISPASTNILALTDISGYGLKSGDKIRIHVDFGGAIQSYRLYINATNKGTINTEDYEYTFAEDGNSIRLNTAQGAIVIDEETGKTVGGTITIHIDYKQGDIPHLQEEIDSIIAGDANTIISRNVDVKDKIYAAKYINVPTTKEQVSLFQLLISGDIHGYSDQMNSIIDYLNAIPNIDAGIMLGDLVGSNYTSDFSFYVPALQKIANNKPFITIAGNHDMGTSTDPTVDAPSMLDYYNRYYLPTLPYAQLTTSEHTDTNCYFFKDFSTYKMRMILLNEYDYPDADLTDLVDGQLRYQRGISMYSQEQINWLIATLNSTPSDYAVIIALHMCPWRMYGEQSPFTATQYEGNFGRSSSAMSGDIIGDIVNAWKNGTTLSETYSIEVPSVRTSVTATADFTARGSGEFVCYLGGHWHNYIISHDQKYNDQLMITVNNASCIARESDMPRLVGGKSEDAFAVMSVDRVNKCINLVTVGARMNCRMVLRETLRIAYDN